MQFSNYISDLLYRYECVILPGFGAFLGHRMPARQDTETHTFFPPYKRISFNAQLRENDGLLANYTATTQQIGYTEALQKVRDFGMQLQADLDAGNRVELETIGSLYVNEEGKTVFEPADQINFLTEAFGLAAYTAQPIIQQEEASPQPETPPVMVMNTSRSNNTWVKYAAAGVLALGITSSLGYFYLKGIADHNLAAAQKARQVVDEKIQEATFTIENPLPAVTLNAFKPKGSYHIVAGAFRVPENADKRVQQLREAGYHARKIGANKYGLHQVVYGSYNDREEALEELSRVRKTDNDRAWLLVQKVD